MDQGHNGGESVPPNGYPLGMASWSQESVPRALLPVLIHEMNNGTQLLGGFRSLLEIPGGEALFAQKAGELAQGSSKLEELGFALAVVSTSSGANMLLARRERRGIEILWELTLRTSCHRGKSSDSRSIFRKAERSLTRSRAFENVDGIAPG